MSDALRDIYSAEFLKNFGKKVHKAYKDFDPEQFTACILSPPWDELQLKARMQRIAEKLGQHLPMPFEDTLQILFSINESYTGFPYLFLPDFVATYGRHKKHFELSMDALERFTQQSSSEFAIRPFLLLEPERVIEHMLKWSLHENEHVRRLSSEGCRTLIRKANPTALALFGYTDFSDGNPLFKNAILTVNPDELQIGDSCELNYSLDIIWDAPEHIRLEYGIDFIKSNDSTSRKLFFLSDKIVSGGSHLSGTRTHRFADLTTRKHYPGIHRITLLVNGKEAAQTILNIKEAKNDYKQFTFEI